MRVVPLFPIIARTFHSFIFSVVVMKVVESSIPLLLHIMNTVDSTHRRRQQRYKTPRLSNRWLVVHTCRSRCATTQSLCSRCAVYPYFGASNSGSILVPQYYAIVCAESNPTAVAVLSDLGTLTHNFRVFSTFGFSVNGQKMIAACECTERADVEVSTVDPIDFPIQYPDVICSGIEHC